jgi:hypothetical protein
MSDPVELSIPPGFLQMLIRQIRAQAVRGGVSTDPDEAQEAAIFEQAEGDLREVELSSEIDALDHDHRHELVALMWVGRGDFGAAEWDEALRMAAERDEGNTARYVLAHPMAGDEIAAGLEELGHDRVLEDGRY